MMTNVTAIAHADITASRPNEKDCKLPNKMKKRCQATVPVRKLRHLNSEAEVWEMDHYNPRKSGKNFQFIPNIIFHKINELYP